MAKRETRLARASVGLRRDLRGIFESVVLLLKGKEAAVSGGDLSFGRRFIRGGGHYYYYFVAI